MKAIKFFSIFLFQLVLVTIIGLTTVNAAQREAFNIITNPGEDMSTSVRINWHSDLNDTFLEYTIADDKEYANKVKVVPDVRTFSDPAANETEYQSEGFSARYVCTAVIDNLKPGTEYMYRVGKTNFSKNYYFKTASNKEFTFVHITDPQYDNVTNAEIFNTLLGKAYEVDIAFSFLTGDVIDRGGKEEHWTILFNLSNIAKGVVAAGVGNHEYYDASGTPKHYNNEWFNGFHNNPQNGPEKVLNSAYYFTYNNALFIMLDTEENSALEDQKAWFSEVCEAHFEKDFIIVGMHRSMYGSQYADDSIRRNWQGLFDKYGVDLVLSGHDHIYARSKSVYRNQISNDPIYGTTYIIGGSGALKFYQAKDNDKYAKVITNTTVANLITVSSSRITMKLIDLDGNVLDTNQISKKRTGAVDSNFNKEDFASGITIEQDPNKTGGTLKWPENFYGNVIQIGIRRADSSLTTSLYLYNHKQTELRFSGLRPDELNTMIIEVQYRDGTIENYNLEVDNTIPYIPTIQDVMTMIKEKVHARLDQIIYKNIDEE